MKHQFLKSALILSSVLAFMNCSEEAANALDNLDPAATQPTENDPSTVTAEESCYLFNAGQDLLIYPIGIVTDASGNVIGTFENGTITGIDGNPIAVNIDLNVLPLTSRQELNASTTPASSATASTQNPTSSANTTATTSSESSSVPGSSATVQNPTSSATVNPTSSDSKQESSSSQQQQTVGNITVTGSLTQTVAKGQTISPITFSPVNEKPKVGNDGQYWFLKFEYDQGSKKFTISGGEQFQYFPEKKISQQFTVDGQSFTLSLTLDEKATAQSSNSQQQAKSSSSQQQPKSSSSVRSSSSSAKSSSSVKSSSSQQQPKSSSSYSPQVSTNFKVKAGGRSGQGWGSRYWDCCMPHCAWSGNTSNPTKTCNAQMQEIGESGGSVCSGGSGGVCDMQAPWAANENLAFAFAAVPAGLGGECGKCFLLTFDGNTHNGGAGANTSGLRGKQMVIMVSNIGGDVQSNQFDIMIPGGGVGQFNGCGNQLGIASTGAQYGGFITDCKSDPSCVKQKCSVFSKYPKLQAGCEFSATWMGGANNPSFKFEELETCPSEISSKW